MPAKMSVNPQDQSVIIDQLTIKNADFFSLIASEPAESQAHMVLDIVAVGSAAMKRVRTTVDVDFVESRFGTLSAVFEKTLGQLEIRALNAISQRFSPTESGSYTRQIGDLLSEAKKDVQSWQRQLEENARKLLDPNAKNSGVGKLDELINRATTSFEQMFDPDRRNSYAYQLNDHLFKLFGTDGHAGALQSILQDALKPVFAELQDLKQKVELKKAAEQIIGSSALKGRPFEESLHIELSRLAQPYSDDIQMVASGSNGSRAGDFMISFAGLGKIAVVEARNRKQISLPSIKTELDREMTERAADLAIYVSSGVEMLPQHVGSFQIYANNKIIVTAENLHIAYRLARLLASLQNSDGDFDLVTLRSVLSKIKDAARSLRNIKSKATQVENFGKAIGTEAGGIEVTLLALIDKAEKLLEPGTLAESA